MYLGPTVASSGTGSHHPGTPGAGAVFPGTIQGSIGDFSGTGLVFPWATNARGKPRRGMMRRAVFSDLQRRGLEKRFQLQKYISKPDRKKLAEKLGLKDSQVSDHQRSRRRAGARMKLSRVIRAEPSSWRTVSASFSEYPNYLGVRAYTMHDLCDERDLRAFSFFFFFHISKQRELAAAETPRVSPPHLLLTFSEQFSEPRESIALHINYERHRGV